MYGRFWPRRVSNRAPRRTCVRSLRANAKNSVRLCARLGSGLTSAAPSPGTEEELLPCNAIAYGIASLREEHPMKRTLLAATAALAFNAYAAQAGELSTVNQAKLL